MLNKQIILAFGSCPLLTWLTWVYSSFPVDPGYVAQYLRTQQVKTRQVKVNLQDVPGKTTLSMGWFKRKSTGKDVGCCFTEYVCVVLICPKSFHQAFSLKAIQWLHQHHLLQWPPSKSANRMVRRKHDSIWRLLATTGRNLRFFSASGHQKTSAAAYSIVLDTASALNNGNICYWIFPTFGYSIVSSQNNKRPQQDFDWKHGRA